MSLFYEVIGDKYSQRIVLKPLPIVAAIFLAIVGLFFLFGSWFSVPAGYHAVVTRFGQVQPKIYAEGVHIKVPLIDTAHDVDTRVLTHTVNAVDAGTKDLQSVRASIAVQFSIEAEDVISMYRNYRDTFSIVNRVLEPALEESVKATTAHYAAEELVTKRSQVRDEIFALFKSKVKSYFLTAHTMSIVNFSFSKSFEDAIDDKVTAEQRALKAQNDLERIRTEAEAIRIQAEAITKQGGAEYVQLQWINKWDGKQPQTVLGTGAMPLISLNR